MLRVALDRVATDGFSGASLTAPMPTMADSRHLAGLERVGLMFFLARWPHLPGCRRLPSRHLSRSAECSRESVNEQAQLDNALGNVEPTALVTSRTRAMGRRLS